MAFKTIKNSLQKNFHQDDDISSRSVAHAIYRAVQEVDDRLALLKELNELESRSDSEIENVLGVVPRDSINLQDLFVTIKTLANLSRPHAKQRAEFCPYCSQRIAETTG